MEHPATPFGPVHHATTGPRSVPLSLAVSCFHPPRPSQVAEPPPPRPRITDQPRVVGIANVLYVHLRVIVRRRTLGVCEEEHGGQGHPTGGRGGRG